MLKIKDLEGGKLQPSFETKLHKVMVNSVLKVTLFRVINLTSKGEYINYYVT